MPSLTGSILSIFRVTAGSDFEARLLAKYGGESAVFVDIQLHGHLNGSVIYLSAHGIAVRVVSTAHPKIEQLRNNQRTLLLIDASESWDVGLLVNIETS